MEMTVSAANRGKRLARTKWVGYLGRIGLAAQGTCFLVVAILALALAAGEGGKATDPRGALVVLASRGWTKVLLVLLMLGFASYGAWRFAQAIFDRGGKGSDAGGLGRRLVQLGQGLIYFALTVVAAKALTGTRVKAGEQRHATAGVLGWPGGRELVGLAGFAIIVSGLVSAYSALSERFKDSLATEEMSPGAERSTTVLGKIGLSSLAVVLGIIGSFLLKAAVEFDSKDALSLGGALSKLANASYGSWLLAVCAAGLLAYGFFGLAQARYHRV